MRKTLLFLCAFAALFSCAKMQPAEPTVQDKGFRVHIRITRSDVFGGTKATVKSGWADGDMVYLFFKDISDGFWN